MSLFVKVYVGSRDSKILVAEAQAHNMSGLRDTSDYKFVSEEYGAPHLGIPRSHVEGEFGEHNRNQTVWALIEKIARLSQ